MADNSEQFKNSWVKRTVQSILLEGIQVHKAIGLAGPNPEEYEKLLKKHATEYILVDVNPINKSIRKNDIVEEVALNHDVNLVDLDFCNTVESNQLEFMYIFNKLQQFNTASTEKILLFTFSLRDHKTTKIETVNAILDILGINHIKELTLYEIRNYPGTRKYINIYSPVENDTLSIHFITYRDSGNNMLSGKIVLKPVSATTSTTASVSAQKSNRTQSLVKKVFTVVSTSRRKSIAKSTSVDKRQNKYEHPIKIQKVDNTTNEIIAEYRSISAFIRGEHVKLSYGDPKYFETHATVGNITYRKVISNNSNTNETT